MKLAREIAEALFPINANTRRYNHGLTREREAQREAATPIIAAKLEPVRDVLYVGLGAAMLVTPRSEPVIDKIKAAIESLSEEE